MELLLDRYPGFTETIRPDDDGATIITVQNNHAQILSENAEMRKQHTQAPKGDQTWGNHVARIPMTPTACEYGVQRMAERGRRSSTSRSCSPSHPSP